MSASELIECLPSGLKGADKTVLQVGAHPGETLLQLCNTKTPISNLSAWKSSHANGWHHNMRLCIYAEKYWQLLLLDWLSKWDDNKRLTVHVENFSLKKTFFWPSAYIFAKMQNQVKNVCSACFATIFFHHSEWEQSLCILPPHKLGHSTHERQRVLKRGHSMPAARPTTQSRLLWRHVTVSAFSVNSWHTCSLVTTN